MRVFSLLLLLSILLLPLIMSPSVATARGRELLVATIGDDQLLGRLPDQARRTVNIVLTDAAPAKTMKDAEETTRRRRRMDERLNFRRFGTRKTPPYGDRVPFTSDYGKIKRHPPKHN